MSEKDKLVAFLKRHGKKSMTDGQYWDGFVESFAPHWYKGAWGDRELPKSNFSKGYSGHFTEKTVASALSLAAGRVIDDVVLVSRSKPFEYPSWWNKIRLRYYEAQGFWNDLRLCKQADEGLRMHLMRNHESLLCRLKPAVREELDELIASVCKPALRERLRKGLSLNHGGDSDEILDGLFVDDLCGFARIYFGFFLLGNEDALARLNPLRDLMPQAIPIGGHPFVFLVE